MDAPQRHTSEHKLCRKLQDARIFGAKDRAEQVSAAQCREATAARIGEDLFGTQGVDNVEGFPANLEAPALANPEFTRERHVQSPVSRADYVVGSHVAERSQRRGA